MGMRETVGSLRAYFIVSGLLSALYALRLSLLVGASIVVIIFQLVTICFSSAFVYVGFTLPKLLKGSTSRIVTLLYASAAWTLLLFVLNLFGRPSLFAVVSLLSTLLILWYLLKNVRRLAGEAHAAPAEPPPPGTS